jgi:hypothetical protein
LPDLRRVFGPLRDALDSIGQTKIA